MSQVKSQIVLLAVGIMLSTFAHAKCELQNLEAQGSEIHAGTLRINLGEADDPAHPTAWQGPLVAGSCKQELSIIEPPLTLSAGRYLYVPTYSGSVRQLYLLDLKNCKIEWQSKTFSGALKISPKGLVLGKKRLVLNGECRPEEIHQGKLSAKPRPRNYYNK